MIEHLSGTSVRVEVKMTRASFAGTILLVESNLDCRFFKRLINHRNCVVLPAYGKDNAILAIKNLADEDFKGVLAIVDADFWHMDGISSPSDNILPTDYHDLELMLIDTRAFSNYMAEYGSSTKIKAFVQKYSKKRLQAILLSRCLPLGVLKWISAKEKLQLKFEGLKYKKFVDKDSLMINRHKLVLTVLSLTEQKSLTFKKIYQDLVNALNKHTFDLFQVCCGHDLTELIGIGLRRALGNQSAKIAARGEVEKSLRLSYNPNDFKKTKLYQLTKQWEQSNKPFVVLVI